MERRIVEFLLIGGCGIFSMCGAIFNWDWFMNHRKARVLVKLLTRTGARIFYGVLGLLLCVVGVLIKIGIISM